MESAPPGYNPNASMLSGGTNAPIMPVQGGGSMMAPVPGYNATVSLLQGGTDAQITAVRGGAVTFKENDNIRTFIKGSESTVEDIGKAVTYFSLEKYKLESETSGKPALESSNERLKRYTNYHNKVALSLKKLVYVEDGTKSSESGRPTYEKCRAVGHTFFETIGINVIILENISFISLIPSLDGNLNRFLAFKEKMLNAEGELPSTKHLVIFTGQFFPTTPAEDSLLLYDELLKLKEKNPGRVFALNDHSLSFIQNSCYILEKFYKNKISAKGKELPLFLEPDIIVLPQLKILFRNSPLPTSKNGAVSLSKAISSRETFEKRVKSILKGSVKPKEKVRTYPNVFILEQGGPEDTVPDYYQFVHMRTSEQSKFPTARYITIKCPDGEDCQGFETGFPLERLASPASLINPALYLLYNNVKNLPYFYKAEKKEEKAKEKETIAIENEKEEEKEEKKVEEVEEVEEIEEIPLPTLPIMKVEPEEEFEFEEIEEESAFIPDPDAVNPKDIIVFAIDLNKYKIRVPSKDVIQNWEKLKFTEDETVFMRKLHLSPEILEAAFKEGKWQKELAKFLENIAYSKCFKDTQLLLATECEFSRLFLKKVYYELYRQSLNKLYKRWSMGISLKTAIGPAENGISKILDEILKRQKALALFDIVSDSKKMNILEEIKEREKKLNVPTTADEKDTKLLGMLESILEKERKISVQDKQEKEAILNTILQRLRDMDLPQVEGGAEVTAPKNKTRKNRKH